MENINVAYALSGGIGYEMFFYSFVGSFIHFLYKWIKAINEAKKNRQPFYIMNWLTESAPTFVFSAMCGIVSVFGASQYWAPITITKSVIVGLLAGSAIFNLLPAATNQQMWKGIGNWIVNKFNPNKKN